MEDLFYSRPYSPATSHTPISTSGTASIPYIIGYWLEGTMCRPFQGQRAKDLCGNGRAFWRLELVE
jgi:hypothetical protein